MMTTTMNTNTNTNTNTNMNMIITKKENKLNDGNINSLEEPSNLFDIYRDQTFKNLQNNLTAPEIDKEYAESSTQVKKEERKKYEEEEKEEAKREKRETHKSVLTQVDFTYEEDLKCVSKILTKKILNEAFIQITYEENLKQLNEKKISVKQDEEANKTVFKKLVDSQKKNLELMKEQNKIWNILTICNKINLFMKSRGLVELLLKENVALLKSTEIFNGTQTMKWQNEVINSLAKTTTAHLKTERMASFTTEELIDETAINLCRSRNKEIIKIKDYINFKKNYLHEQRKINKGHLSLLLNIEDATKRVQVKVEEHMLLHDVLKKVKFFIKREWPFLKDEYNLNFVKIKNKDTYIKNVKELCMSEPGDLTICLVRKIQEKKK